MRLIDADKLTPSGYFIVDGNNPKKSIDELIGRIQTAPTVDAVEVVRCKDCKWFNKAGYDNSCEDDLNLHRGYCLEWRRGTQARRFCSYGERKDNGTV